VLRKRANVVPPISTRTEKAMDEKDRPACTGMKIVDASSIHFNKCLFVTRLRSLLQHGKILSSIPARPFQLDMYFQLAQPRS
jgi:hypothetical protein